MSAGRFTRSRYEASYGNGSQIHPIKIQPETAALTIGGTTNAPPTAASTNPISAIVSRGRRSLGLHARTATIAFTSTVPEGYTANAPIRLPLLNTAIALVATRGAEGIYLQNPIQVVGTTPEEVK